MPLGFGDRSTVELLLDITGRNDASLAARGAADDMRKLSAQQREYNAAKKAENDILKANNDLRRAAHDAENLEQSRAAYADTTDKRYNKYDNPDRYVQDLAKAEQGLKRLKQVETESGAKKWVGLSKEDIDALQEHMDKNAMNAGQMAEEFRSGRLALQGWNKESGAIADKFSNIQRAHEALGMHGDELAMNLNNAETAARLAQWKEFNDVMDESSKHMQDFDKAWRDSDRALQASSRTILDTGKYLGDFGDDAEKAINKLDTSSKVLGAISSKLDTISGKIQHAGGGSFLWHAFTAPVTLPLEAVGKFFSIASSADKFFSKFTGILGPVAGPVSALLGLLTALAAALAVLPVVIGVAVTAFSVLATTVSTAVAAFAAFVPPLAVLGVVLGGLGLAFGYTAEKMITSSGKQTQSLEKLHAAQDLYNTDLKKYGAGAHQTETALASLQTAQKNLRDEGPALHNSLNIIKSSFDSLRNSLAKRFAPDVMSMIGAGAEFVKYLDRVAKMPTGQALFSLTTTGVNKLTMDLIHAGHAIGPAIRAAIAGAFSGTANRDAERIWNDLNNFFRGKHGALIPMDKWFDTQHFTDTGVNWSNQFLHWLDTTGVGQKIASFLSTAIKNGIREGVEAGVKTLTTELGTIGGLKSLGSALASPFGVGAGLGIGARMLLARGGVASGTEAGPGLLGTAGAALSGGGGVALGGPAAIAALLSIPALGAYLSTRSTNLFGQHRSGSLGAMNEYVAAHVAAVLQTAPQGSFDRSQTISLARYISGRLNINPRARELNRSFSLAAGRPLAPNELEAIANQPSQYQRSLISQVATATGKIPTERTLHFLTNIPQVALPAIIKLMDDLHHIPGHKRVEIAVKGAEAAQKPVEELYTKLHKLSQERHLINMEKGNTHPIDTAIAGIKQKLGQLTHDRHDIGKGLYLKPNYSQITNNATAIGKSVDTGIENGLVANKGIVLAEASSIANQIITEMQDAIKAKSPSQVAAIKIGVPIIQGITQGMVRAVNAANSGSNSAKSVMQTMLQTMLGVFDNFKSQFQQGFGTLFTGVGGTGVNPATGFPTQLATLLGFPGAKIPFSAVSGDLRAQLQAFKKFSRGLNQLARKGYAPLLIQQIAALGPAAQPEIDALLSADTSQVKQYDKMFHEANRAINNASMKQTVEQLDIWKRAGKGVALGILAGLRSAEPGIEDIIAKIISRILANSGKGGHGHNPHGTVVHQTIHANRDESLQTTLRKASWHYRTVA